jgi:hypothetical protein
MRDILSRKIRDQCGFAGSGFTYDVSVMTPVGMFDTKTFGLIAEVGLAEGGNFLHPFSVGRAAIARKQSKGLVGAISHRH